MKKPVTDTFEGEYIGIKPGDIKGSYDLNPRLNAISDEFKFYISPTIARILKITGEATFEIDGDIYKLTKEKD